jgi:hypothetical protein
MLRERERRGRLQRVGEEESQRRRELPEQARAGRPRLIIPHPGSITEQDTMVSTQPLRLRERRRAEDANESARNRLARDTLIRPTPEHVYQEPLGMPGIVLRRRPNRDTTMDEANHAYREPFGIPGFILRRRRSTDATMDEANQVVTEQMKREARLLMGTFQTIKLSLVHINEVSVCAICLNEHQVGEDACQMPCHKNHIFHPECIQQWLERQKSCPLCKTPCQQPSQPSP